ncbi:MAG: hypothetical protein ABI830_10360 [Pseudolabrys sp.]
MLTNARLRLAVLVLAGAQTLFWLFTFYYINAHANPRGDGMEWLAIVPMTIIFSALVVPALILGGAGGRFALAAKIGAGFVVVGLGANIVVWLQILGEFAHKTLR